MLGSPSKGERRIASWFSRGNADSDTNNNCRHLGLLTRGVVIVLCLTMIQYLGQLSYNAHLERQSIPTGMTRKRGNWNSKDVPFRARTNFGFPNSKTDTEKMHKTTVALAQVFNENHTITLEDLTDLDFSEDPLPPQTWEEAALDREPLLDILTSAGLHIDVGVLQRLPTWSQVVDLYGAEPVVVGHASCKPFVDTYPANKRFLGVAGQMNTGTNALAKYLKNNLVIAANEVSKGMLWTVPWYKHGWASLKGRYTYRIPDDHDSVLAVVMIRDPYFWMQSMCESPYTLEWNKSATHCPTMINPQIKKNKKDPEVDFKAVQVRVRWDKKFVRSWPSLAHMWSSWYNEYIHSPTMPHLVIRFEDLLFHTKAVMEQVRECVDAEWKNDEFQWAAAPAKTHPYFARFKAPSSLISAMIKYGKDSPRRMGTMTPEDLAYAQEAIDPELLKQFHYRPATMK